MFLFAAMFLRNQVEKKLACHVGKNVSSLGTPGSCKEFQLR